eukprot:TRINITY_DN56448_c0_g1_i1.p1 TRINITY_DN56448_c0_g1~~TRINITY_DN56448_c0_g1_i1.p1  ORF type:complete len:140 (-),score=24.11 TRINITY_DN56448_c0_g1_i1:93-512(-)
MRLEYALLLLPLHGKLRIGELILAEVLSHAGLAGFVRMFSVWCDLTVQLGAHQLMGTVLGFLLVVMNNMSVSNHEKAITLLNNMVQQGISLCAEILPSIKGTDHIICAEREDFRRLVILYLRLACYEVRADMQAQEHRK